MLFLILAAVLAALVYLPSVWVRHVMSENGKELNDLPGTGGELAEHLIKRFEKDGRGGAVWDGIRWGLSSSNDFEYFVDYLLIEQVLLFVFRVLI